MIMQLKPQILHFILIEYTFMLCNLTEHKQFKEKKKLKKRYKSLNSFASVIGTNIKSLLKKRIYFTYASCTQLCNNIVQFLQCNPLVGHNSLIPHHTFETRHCPRTPCDTVIINDNRLFKRPSKPGP